MILSPKNDRFISTLRSDGTQLVALLASSCKSISSSSVSIAGNETSFFVFWIVNGGKEREWVFRKITTTSSGVSDWVCDWNSVVDKSESVTGIGCLISTVEYQ